jgi:hypothetical protein
MPISSLLKKNCLQDSALFRYGIISSIPSGGLLFFDKRSPLE